jgi:hypothetical protein
MAGDGDERELVLFMQQEEGAEVKLVGELEGGTGGKGGGVFFEVHGVWLGRGESKVLKSKVEGRREESEAEHAGGCGEVEVGGGEALGLEDGLDLAVEATGEAVAFVAGEASGLGSTDGEGWVAAFESDHGSG